MSDRPMTDKQRDYLGDLLVRHGRSVQATAVLAGVCEQQSAERIEFDSLTAEQASEMISFLLEEGEPFVEADDAL